MSYYVTTDWHISHHNIIEYCHRPEDFNEQIKTNLAILNKDDILINLGDLCFGNKNKQILMHEEYVLPLPCQKWLIKGNHDNQKDSWYLTHGWDKVYDVLQLTAHNQHILFSHYPQEEGEFDINIHGHTHATDNGIIQCAITRGGNDKRCLIAIEKTAYKPVLLETIIHDFLRRPSVKSPKENNTLDVFNFS